MFNLFFDVEVFTLNYFLHDYYNLYEKIVDFCFERRIEAAFQAVSQACKIKKYGIPQWEKLWRFLDKIQLTFFRVLSARSIFAAMLCIIIVSMVLLFLQRHALTRYSHLDWKYNLDPAFQFKSTSYFSNVTHFFLRLTLIGYDFFPR